MGQSSGQVSWVSSPLQYPSPHSTVPVLQTALRAAGFEDAHVDPIEPTMEDVFIDRVKSSEAGVEL